MKTRILMNRKPIAFNVNVHYLIAFLFPFVAFTYMYISQKISDAQFEEDFGEYIAIPCIVYKVDCQNHGHYNIIKRYDKDAQVYESSHRGSCAEQYQGKEITGYFSAKKPEMVSFLEPRRIISWHHRVKWDLWIPAFCLGIPFYLFSYIQTYHGRAKYFTVEFFKNKS